MGSEHQGEEFKGVNEAMRETKFRAWLKQERKMREVSGFFFSQVMFISAQEKATQYTINSVPETQVELMSFTGLKDRYGKDIYEGDILRGYHALISLAPVYQVVWNKDRWDVMDSHDRTYDRKYRWESPSWNDLEIIGNLYENPELMKESTNG
jgi:uncharacterized phage protein (TIGR01671 family)